MASGLAEDKLRELGDLITELARDTGVLVIEHRMDLMMSVCDHIFVLDFGVLIAQGSAAEVQANPLVTEAYLGALHEEATHDATRVDGGEAWSEAALEVREVSAGYGAVPVLRSVTITAQAGTITAVLEPTAPERPRCFA